MRGLERQYRVTARSIPEVVGPMERALTHYGMSRGVTFRGRKLSNEAFINAALLHLLELPPEDQAAALSAAVARLEAILSGDGVGKVAPADPAGGDAAKVYKPLPIEVESVSGPLPPAVKARRKEA